MSYSVWQQTVLYAATYGVGDGSDTPANRALVRQILSTDLAQAADIAARQLGHWWAQEGDPINALCRYNAPGLNPSTNPNRPNYERGWDAAQAYRAGEAPAPAYNPDQPPERQVQSWTCSVRTATWLLRSLGVPTDAGTIQDRMVAAGLVSPADGLEDGTGAALRDWLATQVPPGCIAHQVPDAPFAVVQQMAGHCPIGMGSGTLYHWVAVRRAPDADTLALMNPAPGYRGLGDTLTRGEFAQWAPWNIVWIALPEGGDDMSAEDQATLAWWHGVEPVMPGFLNTVEDQAAALARRTTGQNREAAKAILAQLASFREVSGFQREGGG